MEELAVVVKQLSIPIAFVDRNPPVPDSEILPKLTYVSVSDKAGGELAADAVLDLTNTIAVKRILVIAGFAKSRRHEAFRNRLVTAETLKGCELVVTQDGKFDRWIAENVAHNHLSTASEESKPFDAVFCTADSMTLGCLDAIERLARRTKIRKPRVIGYDGTTTTKNLIDTRQSPLTRVVIQDSKELAGAAIAQLIKLNQSEEDVKKVIWIDPYLYPSLQRASI
jgi:ABC-type sugar transport system substrate-binding protein